MEENAGWWVLVGGVVIVVGSFLPWITATSVFGSLSRNALDGDGRLTLAAGVILALIGAVEVSSGTSRRPAKILGWVMVIVVGLVFAVDFSDLQERLDLVSSELIGASASIGPGLWLLAVGALIAVIGVLNLRTNERVAQVDRHPDLDDRLAQLAQLEKLRAQGSIDSSAYYAARDKLKDF